MRSRPAGRAQHSKDDYRAPIDVFCLPFAGSGASFYRNAVAVSSPHVVVHPVQPAGREERFSDQQCTTLTELTIDLASLIAAELDVRTEERPFCLFGHSFGAVLAFEIAHELCVSRGYVAARLFVSGSAHPGAPLTRRSAHLSDEEFVREVEELAGYVHPALAEPELGEIVLPVLRADVAMHESYRPRSDHPLPVPITTLRGTDDALVSRDECRGWAQWTSRGCTHLELDGGHMYLTDDLSVVVDVIEGALLAETDQ